MQTPLATASLPTFRKGVHCTKALRPVTPAVRCAVRFSTLLGTNLRIYPPTKLHIPPW